MPLLTKNTVLKIHEQFFFFPKMPCLTLHGTELLAVNFADEEEINIGGLSSRSALPKWEPLILYGHLNLDLI